MDKIFGDQEQFESSIKTLAYLGLFISLRNHGLLKDFGRPGWILWYLICNSKSEQACEQPLNHNQG